MDGKLKTRVINGEEFPPLERDCPGVKMDYPPGAPIPEEAKFALGHPFFALLPGLFVRKFTFCLIIPSLKLHTTCLPGLCHNLGERT